MKRRTIFLSIILFLLLFFVVCITTFIVHSNSSFTTSSTDYYFSSDEFTWPLPDYFTISSPFGLRISPTTGASTYHSGVDIPAPEETSIYSACSGKVIYLDYERSEWLHFKN